MISSPLCPEKPFLFEIYSPLKHRQNIFANKGKDYVIVEAETLATWENSGPHTVFRAKKSKVVSLRIYTTKCAQVSVVYAQPEVS